jgi:hypothetical protein
MAAKKIDQKVSSGNGGGRLKFRYVDPERYVDLDVTNVDQYVADQFRSLVTSLSGRGVVAPVRNLVAAPTSTAAAAVEEEDTQETATIEAPVQDPGANTADETTSNGSERKRRIPPNPKIVDSLDIHNGEMPLPKFVEQKGPRKAQDRIVLVAVWLKKYQGREEFNRDDLYPCFQQMGGSGDWKCPNDWDAPLRQLAKRKGWFTKGSTESSFKVTIVASNYVDNMAQAEAA